MQLTGTPTDAKRSAAAWLDLGRSAVFMTLLCTGIAVLLTVLGHSSFGVHLIYSFAIGICCWLVINGGRYGATHMLNRLRLAKGEATLVHAGFPGWGWMAPVTLLGMLLGPMMGTALADLITGNHSPGLWQWGSPSTRVTIVVSVLATLVSVFVLGTLARLSIARAQAEAAQRAAAENQLKLLESQLEPHMLFNTLANLRVLIARDPPQAQAMLDQLIGFLRSTLGASRVSEHALSAEFARLADYLALLKVRMGERLQVHFDLPAALADAPIAPLLLQPLVENAIKHGLEPKVSGGRIAVSARQVGNTLVLCVRDTGCGLSDSPSEGTRFGLQQVRARLSTLYGGAASVDLCHADDAEGGTLATVRLPFKTS
jgi:hypothetical protein